MLTLVESFQNRRGRVPQRPRADAISSRARQPVLVVSTDDRKIAAELVGRWRIGEMSGWDIDAIDLVGPGFIEFAADGTGQFGFIAVRGWLDCRLSVREGRVGVEFSWQGDDEGDDVSGRGWAAPGDDAGLEGHLYFHLGDDSTFLAVPSDAVRSSG